jgi:hypothetical protein
MSFRGLLAHRGTLQRPETTNVDGVATYDWVTVATGVPCRVDLSFIRNGKDPRWSPEAGRVEDRTGVAFFPPEVAVASGQRLILTGGGITGTFRLDGNVEEIIGRRDSIHHREVGITEVPGPLV